MSTPTQSQSKFLDIPQQKKKNKRSQNEIVFSLGSGNTSKHDQRFGDSSPHDSESSDEFEDSNSYSEEDEEGDDDDEIQFSNSFEALDTSPRLTSTSAASKPPSSTKQPTSSKSSSPAKLTSSSHPIFLLSPNTSNSRAHNPTPSSSPLPPPSSSARAPPPSRSPDLASHSGADHQIRVKPDSSSAGDAPLPPKLKKRHPAQKGLFESRRFHPDSPPRPRSHSHNSDSQRYSEMPRRKDRWRDDGGKHRDPFHPNSNYSNSNYSNSNSQKHPRHRDRRSERSPPNQRHPRKAEPRSASARLDARQASPPLIQQRNAALPATLAYGRTFPLEEDHATEFKSVAVSHNPIETISKYSTKYINAFLNSSGGRIIYGVADDGEILGIPLNRKDRDLARLRVDAVVSSMTPQVDPSLIEVSFIPVEVSSLESRRLFARQFKDAYDDAAQTRYVLCVAVKKGIAPVYFTRAGYAFLRRSGSTYPMDASMVAERGGASLIPTPSLSHRALSPASQPHSQHSPSAPHAPPEDAAAAGSPSSSEAGRPPIVTVSPPAGGRTLVGRSAEIDQIREFALRRDAGGRPRTSIVVLWGSPLVGKSALAKQALSQLHDLYPDRKMLIDLKGVTTPYVGYAEARLSVIRQIHPSKTIPRTEAEILGLYESCFAEKHCILLIENVGLAQQVMELVPVSAASILILVTTRFDLMLDAITESLCIRLQPLSLEKSLELFRGLVGHAFVSEHDAQEIEQLVDACQGRALFIRMIAASVLRSPSKFKQLLDRMLNREEKYEFFARTLPFDPLDSELLECYLPLGVFRNTFSAEAAAAVWGPAGPYPSRSFHPSMISKTLHQLVDAALLIKLRPNRYQLPDFLQVHCYRYSRDVMAAQLSEWRSRFIAFYLGVLHKLKYLAFEYAAQEASDIFILEQGNFQTAIDYARQVGPASLGLKLTRSVEWFIKHSLSVVEQEAWRSLLHPLPKSGSAAAMRRSNSATLLNPLSHPNDSMSNLDLAVHGKPVTVSTLSLISSAPSAPLTQSYANPNHTPLHSDTSFPTEIDVPSSPLPSSSPSSSITTDSTVTTSESTPPT